MNIFFKNELKATKKDYLILSLVIIGSLLQLIYYIKQNSIVNYYDETRYYEISKIILENGLFSITDELRTYLYPLLIALIHVFTDGNVVNVKIAFSIFQYLIYAITIFEISKFAFRIADRKLIFHSIIFCGLLNPYLIQATTLFLTDILATCLIMISLIYLIKSDLNKISNGAVVAITLYSSVLIRPSSAIFMILFLLIGLYRLLKQKDFKPYKFIAVGLVCLVIFLPQIYMNVTKFNHFTPLIHLNLFEQQSIWASQYLKYSTVIIEGETPQLYFPSPWILESNMSIYKLAFHNFGAFLTVVSSHLFGMLDWGYVDAYVKNLDGTTRLLPSVLLWLNWLLIFIGVYQFRIKRKESLFIINSLLFASICYTLFMSMTAIESRFGYPSYLLLLVLAGFGLEYLIENRKRKKHIITIGIAMILLVCFVFYISYLIDMQTGRITWF
ncbi:hypothetical protein [Paenibacillus sp. NPDC058071]|uniref:hypothetical protein n=1 Tax=Paenibacillus sp. NPDC058071 TaxID=3346326 RepID=UPI0036DF761C